MLARMNQCMEIFHESGICDRGQAIMICHNVNWQVEEGMVFVRPHGPFFDPPVVDLTDLDTFYLNNR